MPLLDAIVHSMLDNLGTLLDQASLHTAFPGSTGASEVTGGTYARQATTWNSAAARNLDSSATFTFDVPSGNTVAWSGFWNTAPSPDVFAGYLPLKQAADWGPLRFQVGLAANTIILEGSGAANDDRVAFFNGTPPTGLTEGTIYWVVTATAADPDTFQVSATQGGAAIGLTADAGAGVQVSQVRPETFGADGQYQLTDIDWPLLGTV